MAFECQYLLLVRIQLSFVRLKGVVEVYVLLSQDLRLGVDIGHGLHQRILAIWADKDARSSYCIVDGADHSLQVRRCWVLELAAVLDCHVLSCGVRSVLVEGLLYRSSLSEHVVLLLAACR